MLVSRIGGGDVNYQWVGNNVGLITTFSGTGPPLGPWNSHYRTETLIESVSSNAIKYFTYINVNKRKLEKYQVLVPSPIIQQGSTY